MTTDTKGQAGRPPLHDKPMEPHTIYVTAEQWTQVQANGGAAYIRRLIDQDTRTDDRAT